MPSLTHTYSQAVPSCLANNSVSGLQILNRANFNSSPSQRSTRLPSACDNVYQNIKLKEFWVTSTGNLYKKRDCPQSLVTIKIKYFTLNYLTGSGQDKRRKAPIFFQKHINSILQHIYAAFPHPEKGHKVNTCRIISMMGCTIRGSVRCSKDAPLYSTLTRTHMEHETQTTLSPSIQKRINWSVSGGGTKMGQVIQGVAEGSGLVQPGEERKTWRPWGGTQEKPLT